MRFLINGPGSMTSVRYKGKRASKAKWKASGFTRNVPKKRKRKLAGAALAAHRKKVQRSQTRTNKRAKARVNGGKSMAKRKRRRATVGTSTRRRRRHAVARRRTRTNPVVRRRRKGQRRRFRRNPSLSGANMAKVAMQGVKDAALILVGKAGTRAVSAMIPFGANVGIVGAVKQVAVALAVGFAAHKALGADAARMVVAGGIVAPLETLVKGLNIPLVSANLGDATGAAGAGFAIQDGRDGMGAYPLAAYPPDDEAEYGNAMG